MYYRRIIDKYLSEWAAAEQHKPVLLRGARQIGKSWAIRHLGESFENFVEINFEKSSEYKPLFQGNLDVKRICSMIGAMSGQPIVAGKTLLFLDEIQMCPEAIMSLRFFKEDYPELHVAAAGSLLEFALEELPTFGVGRIHSMFMHPMTFDEFLLANRYDELIEFKQAAHTTNPLPLPLHEKLTEMFRVYLMVGGMPEVVAKWVEGHDYTACQQLQDELLVSYEDDFPKYKKKADPILLRHVLRSAAVQTGKKFVYTQVSPDYKSAQIRQAVDMLVLAGLLIPVTHSNANGLPLGSEADTSYRKMLLFDCGLMLRLLNLSTSDASQLATQILTASAADLVNKGSMAEMVAGLELLRYKSPNLRHDLFYWTRQQRNSLAEVDYLEARNMQVLPIEVKAGTQGGMKSLWMLMREKRLTYGIRCSLENFSFIEHKDTEADNAIRHVDIYPLYAISSLF